MRAWRVAGVAAGAAGIGVGELMAAWIRPDASPYVAVADAVVDLTPAAVKDVAIALLGPMDKVVLLVGVAAVLVWCAYGIGRLGERSPRGALVGIGGLAAVGVLAAVTRPGAGVTYAVPSVAAGLVAAGVFTWLAGLVPSGAVDVPAQLVGAREGRQPDGAGWSVGDDDERHDRREDSEQEDDRGDGELRGQQGDGEQRASEQDREGQVRRGTGVVDVPGDDDGADPGDFSEAREGAVGSEATAPAADTGAVAHAEVGEGAYGRRRFLVASGLTGAGAVAAVALGRWVAYDRFGAARSRASLRVPRPDSPATGTVRDVSGGVPGLSRFHTPNRDFYRVDTALAVPQLRADEWQLKLHGMVARPLVIDYQQLLRRELIERDITLACVSNQVGGPYVGNARWIGVPLKGLLEEAGVAAGADQVVSRSHDGMTIGTPTAALTDGRDAMLAVAMNGELLPLEHGFPVRMVVPGLYGYVSACKWIVEMELTTFEAYDAYWIKQGWAEQAEIKTASRIDTPKSGAAPRAGEVVVAGVAWAQHRGIARVEVQVDDGPWRDAELAADTSIDSWRQWRYRWQAGPGRHRLRVRATDGEGERQTDREQDSFPDGATGWHTVEVTVGA